jgi:hypothetical protein
MEFPKELIQKIVMLNKEYIYLAKLEESIRDGVIEILSRLPEYFTYKHIYISQDLEIHQELVEIFKKHINFLWKKEEENFLFIITLDKDSTLGEIPVAKPDDLGRVIDNERLQELIIKVLNILFDNYYTLKNYQKLQPLNKS